MIRIHSDYKSPNGLSFHHATSVPSPDGRHSYYRAESHQMIEVLVLLAGKIDYSINGAIYSIVPGDCIIVNAQELHSLKIDPDIPYERYVLQFSPTFIPKLYDQDLSSPFINAHLYQHIIPKEIVAKSRISQILSQIKNLCEDHSKFGEAKIIAKIVDLITEINIAVELLLTTERNMIPVPKSKNELLQAIIKYINDNINKDINTQEIADSLGISQSYLYRFFKSKMNITIHNYIHNQKMQLALTLINQGHSPQNVATLLGYTYYTTFYAQFKKTFYKSPTSLISSVEAARAPTNNALPKF